MQRMKCHEGSRRRLDKRRQLTQQKNNYSSRMLFIFSKYKPKFIHTLENFSGGIWNSTQMRRGLDF